jgi:integrase
VGITDNQATERSPEQAVVRQKRAQLTPKMQAKLAAGAWLGVTEICRLAQDRGKHRIAPKVYLVVRRSGTGRGYVEWRDSYQGQTKHLGLGGWTSASPALAKERLAEIQDQAATYERQRRHGLDPLTEKRAQTISVLFRDAASQCIAARRPSWRSAVHAQQWTNTLETFAFPAIGHMPVQAVDTQAVLTVLKVIWTDKSVTAGRVRNRIEAVLDYSASMGWRHGENPARWKGHLANLLPAIRKIHQPQHLGALDWRALPALMAKLEREAGVSSAAVRFLVLTAARLKEVRLARWPEINLAAGLWTVPGARMKGGRQHTVPLSPPALATLEAVAPLRKSADSWIFPGWKVGRPLSSTALLEVLARRERDATLHGMRAAFRTWAAEATEFPRELAELSLAHRIAGDTEEAYQRSNLLDRRRALLAEWGAFCTRAA